MYFFALVVPVERGKMSRWKKITDEYDRCNDNRHPKNKEEEEKEEENVWEEKSAGGQDREIFL